MPSSLSMRLELTAQRSGSNGPRNDRQLNQPGSSARNPEQPLVRLCDVRHLSSAKQSVDGVKNCCDPKPPRTVEQEGTSDERTDTAAGTWPAFKWEHDRKNYQRRSDCSEHDRDE